MSIGIEVAPSDPGSGAPAGRSRGRTGGLIALLAGTVLFTASLVGVSEAMRYVIETNGGYCASGGPYEIASGHECDGGAIGLLVGGIFAMLLGGAIALAGSGAYLGARGFGLIGLMWAALFGLLGWNFIEFALDPPANLTNEPPIWGFLIPGVMFWLMAAPGLLGPITALKWRRRDEQALTGPPAPSIVMANVPGAGAPESSVVAVPQPAAAESPAAPWIAVLVAGSVGGVLAGLWLSELVL